jgi:subtilisin family serine protease
MAEDLKEYIISVENKDQLDTLYEKMESKGGSEFIPDRKVEVAHRRPMSRNTHYMLTQSEAENLKNEIGIINVELSPKDIGARPRPHWIQRSSDWDRCGSGNTNDINWGLLRSSLIQNIDSWGASFCTPGDKEIISSSDGLNVDVVISDGMVNPAHPEMALNPNGTGGARVVQYNWLRHRLEVEGTANGTYIYTPYNDTNNADRTSDNNHGMHVAGTVAGNRQGWAKRANIYNINPYETDINSINDLFHFDYIRAFHRAKTANPATRVINPTVVNASWGYSSAVNVSNIQQIRFQGTTFNSPFNISQLFSLYNLANDEVSEVYLPFRYTALEIDIQDAINEGIIIVSSAGNDTMKIDVLNGTSWNDEVKAGNVWYQYHRGSSPSADANVICVGAVGNYSLDTETKAYYSNYGPRINVWAPGSSIISSVHTNGTADPRNSNFLLDIYSGTSMASPQVCGVIACLLQKYPSLKQADVLKFLNEKLSIIDGLSDDDSDLYGIIDGATTRYLYNYPHKKYTGQTVPDFNYNLRQNNQVKYPRTKIHRKVINT